jgi:phospholipid/cholesterol/gamma-HCH transport system ATP-binding protein
MIKVISLEKAFNGLEVLKGLNLTISEKEVIAVIGRSGEGKSVLLKHLLGLIKPDKGNILIEGKILQKPAAESWIR